jgi:hypothetical protein
MSSAQQARARASEGETNVIPLRVSDFTDEPAADAAFLAPREKMLEGFVRLCGWFGLHVMLLVGYLTSVFALGMDWLTALMILFVAGLLAGWIMGLTRAWVLAMLVQALIVVGARIAITLFTWLTSL